MKKRTLGTTGENRFVGEGSLGTPKGSGHLARGYRREKCESLRETIWARLAGLQAECRPRLSTPSGLPREAPLSALSGLDPPAWTKEQPDRPSSLLGGFVEPGAFPHLSSLKMPSELILGAAEYRGARQKLRLIKFSSQEQSRSQAPACCLHIQMTGPSVPTLPSQAGCMLGLLLMWSKAQRTGLELLCPLPVPPKIALSWKAANTSLVC